MNNYQNDPLQRVAAKIEPVVDFAWGMFWLWFFSIGAGIIFSLPMVGIPATVVIMIARPGIDLVFAFILGTSITFAFMFAVGASIWAICKLCGQNPWRW